MRPYSVLFVSAVVAASTLLENAPASADSPCDGLVSKRVSPETVCGLTELLASDAYAGRVVGSSENAATRQRLVSELEARGVTPAGASGFLQSFSVSGTNESAQVHNIVGIYDPAGVGGAPTVLLSAHYDGIPVCDTVSAPGISSVCNAAADNMTGVAAILGILDVVGPDLTTPIAVAFWDGEEAVNFTNELGGAQLDRGLLGSVHFALNPTFDRSALRLHINFESLGFNAFEGMDTQVFAIGTESGGPALSQDVAQVLGAQTYPLEDRYVEFAMAQKRCDLEGFVRRNWTVPYVMFSDGPSGLYHSSADDAAHVNFRKVMAVAEAAADLTVEVAAADRGYVYDGDIPLLVWIHDVLYRPSYDQLFVLQDVTHDALANLDGAQYPGTQQALLDAQTKLQNWVNGGAWWWSLNFVSAVSWFGTDFFPIFTHHAQERLESGSP